MSSLKEINFHVTRQKNGQFKVTRLVKVSEGTWQETWPIQRNVPAETFMHELPHFFEDVQS